MVKLFYNTKVVRLKSDEDYEFLNGKRVARDVVSKQTGEVIMEVGERISMDMIDRIKEEKIHDVEVIEFPNNKEDSFLSTTLEVEKEFINKHVKSPALAEHKKSELALLTIHAIMWQSEPTNLENAQEHFNRLFFDPKTYSLGAVGRYKIIEQVRHGRLRDPDAEAGRHHLFIEIFSLPDRRGGRVRDRREGPEAEEETGSSPRSWTTSTTWATGASVPSAS